MNKEEFISNEMMNVATSLCMIAKLLKMHNGSSKDDWIIRAQAADTLHVIVAHVHNIREILEESTGVY